MEQSLIDSRADKLNYYTPYCFIKTEVVDFHSKNYLESILQKIAKQTFVFEKATEKVVVLHELLTWDTDYFARPCFKILNVFFENNFNLLFEAISYFKEQLSKVYKSFYLFTDIPSEDTLLLQALTAAGFRLVESRLHYFKDKLQNFDNQRFSIRYATIEDIGLVQKIACNAYDRLHADVYFDDTIADKYLATYAAACVTGFADKVLLPYQLDMPSEAFLAIKNTSLKINDTKKLNFARVMLTAVLQSCRGWHYKLVSETIFYAQQQHIDYVLMTTQATNRAVTHNCEKLGFQLANLSHILVVSK